MNRLKRIILSSMVALGVMAPAMMPAVAHAQGANPRAGLNCGAELTFPDPANLGECEVPDSGTDDFNNIITIVINVISIIVGLVAVVMIIVGGFRYITSNGDSGAVSSAKNTILYAIVGLVIVALAQIIVRFVLANLAEVGDGGTNNGTDGGAVGNSS